MQAIRNRYLLFIFFLIPQLSFSQIQLNEIYLNPDDGGGSNCLTCAGGKEYIELYNKGCTAVNLSGYFIAHKKGSGGTASGFTIRIPNVANAVIPAGGHRILGTAIPPGASFVTGNFDITLTASDVCSYSAGPQLPNDNGWIALYDSNGEPLDLVYWSANTSDISNSLNTNFNPAAPICLPAGSPTITLKNAYEINQSKSCVIAPINDAIPYFIWRPQDAAPGWNFLTGSFAGGSVTINATIAANNCNGGACRASNPLLPTPVAGTITNANSCSGTGSFQLTGLPVTEATNNNNCPATNWTVTVNPGGTTAMGNTSTTTINNLAPGSYTVTVQNERGCVSNASAPIIISGPQINNPSANQNLCIGSTPSTFSVNTDGIDQIQFVYSNTQLTGNAIYTSGTPLGSPVSPASGVASYSPGALGTTGSLPNVVGTYYVYAIIGPVPANTSCRPSAEIIVTVFPPPVIANAGPDQKTVATCGTTQVTLAANTATVGTGTWSIVSGTGGSITNVNNPTTTFSGISGNTYILRWTITNGSCTPSTDDVEIFFNPPPTPANAGPDQTGASTCGQTSVTLAANSPTIGTGVWSLVSGAGGIFSDVNSPTSTFTGTPGITYTLRWTVTNICGNSTDDVIITFNQNPTTANAGADRNDATTCGLNQITLAANAPTIGSGQWSVVSGTGGFFNNISIPTPIFNGVAGNTYTFRWTISNNPCTASFDDVVITFNQNPTNAAAGPDQTGISTCGSTTATLAAVSPTIGSGQWSIVSGTGGSITDINNPASSFTGTAGTSYTLRWTVSNAPCTAQTDDVVITFNQNPTTANAGPDQTDASTCGLTQVTLAANTPTIGAGQWSILSGTGGSITNASSPTSTFSGTPGSTYNLRWTVSNSPCNISTDDVVITFNQNPSAASAGTDQTGTTTCGQTQVTLNATAPAIGTGTWSVVSGAGGNFGNVNSPASTFSGTPGVAYTLRWTSSSSASFCASSSDDVLVTFNQNPTPANAGADRTDASTCGLTQLTLAGNTSTIGTGQWSVVSGTGGFFNNIAIPTPIFNGIAGNTYTFRWTISNSPCPASTDDVIVTFNQNPTPANAGADQIDASTCGATQVNLNANTPTVGTGVWSIVSGTGGSFGNINNAATTFDGVAGSSYTLRWTITNGTICTPSTDDVIITFNQNPSAPQAGADQTDNLTCGQTSVTLAANTPTVGTGAWSIVSGAGGTITNTTSATSTFNGLSGSTYTLRWTVSNSPCTALSDDVVVTFNQSPTTATAGADQTGSSTCGQTSVILAANTPTVGTGAWTIVSGSGGSFSDATSPTSTFSGTAGTTYTLRWTISNSCGNSTDDVDITFNQNPTAAAAGADQTGIATCGGTQVILAANNPTVGTGAWTIVNGTGGIFGNATSPTSTFDGVAGNTYTLRWTVSNNPCNALSDDVVVTFNQNPSTPLAGADQTGASTCGGTQVTLAANNPTVGTGAWSIVSGTGGSLANATSPTSTFDGVSGSTYTLRWTVSNNPCNALSDDVVITFNRNPTTANAGADQTDAATCGRTQVNLTANNPTVGTGQWSIVSGSGGTIGNINNASTTFDGVAGNTYILRWTISNSPCTASSDDVTITFNQNPTIANAGADQIDINTCGRTQVNLTANNPTVGTGQWSIVSGAGGSIGNINNASTTLDGVAGSTYTLRWTVSTGGICPNSTDDVAITFNQNPTPANAGADRTDASTCGLTQLTLAGNTPTIGAGQWSVVSGTGGFFNNIAIPTPIFNGIAGNTYTFRWTISNSPCPASSDDVVVTFNQNPTPANAGADQIDAATCGLTQVNLLANSPATGTGQWSIVSGIGGNIGNSNNATTTLDGVAGNTYTLSWTVSNSPCTASSDNVTITFNQNTTPANAGADQIDAATCGKTQVNLSGNTPAIGTGAWSIVSGTGGSFGNTTSPTSTFDGIAGSTYTLRWTVSNSPCTAQSDDVVITFNQSPTTADAGADQTDAATCGLTQVNLNANTPTAGTGAWSIVSGTGGSFGDITSPTSTFTGVAGSTYVLQWTISNSCGNSSDNVTITFNQNPSTADAGTDQIGNATCGLTQVTLGANIPAVGTGVWSIVSGSGGSFGNSNNSTTSFDGVAGSSYTLRWTASNSPCPASFDNVVVTFNQNPTIAFAGADQIDIATCGQTQVTLSANTAAVGTGTWSIVSGAGGSFTNINDPATTFNGTPGVAYNLRWTISNNPCTASFDDVFVSLNQNPTTANAGPDQTDVATCGLTQVTLAANTPAIGSGIWSIVSGTGGNITSVNSPNSTFSGVAGSTYVLRWTISNSPCNSSSDDVTITFNENPTTSIAGADQTDINTCGLTQVNLSANVPAIGNGQWSIVSGSGGSFGNANNNITTFDGVAGTAYTLRWTISNTPCVASFDDILVTFNQIPTTANAGADQIDVATCGLTQVNLAANTAAVGTGTWTIVSGTGGSFGNVSSPTSSFNGTAGETYTLRWTISNSPCTASTDDVIVTFNQNPTTSNAGPNQIDAATCGRTQVNLTANAPAVGTGQWTIVSGIGGSFGNSIDPFTTFDGVAGNSYTLRWSITNGIICPVSTDDIDITFNQAPTPANAGADQVDAATCGLTQVTLGANIPSIGTGQWSIVSGTGGSIANTTDPSSLFDGTPGNTYTLRWTTSNGIFCPNSTDEVIIVFNQIPTAATAGTDQTNTATCGLTQVLLGANTPTVGSGQWSLVSGAGGNIGNITDPNTLFSGVAGNTYTLRWTIDNSPCAASSDDVLVTFNRNPASPTITVSQQPDCFIATGTLSITSPTGNTLEYSNDGTSFQSTTQFSGLAPGNYTITVRDNGNGCISSAISPAITAQPLPSVVPIIGNTETYCQGDNASPLRALGNNLRWYTSATGGTPNANAPVPSTASAGTFNYYVTQQITGFCESPRVAISVSIKALPVADAGPDKEIVQGQRVEIEGNASGNNIDILWTPGTFLSNAKIENPFASPEESTTYRITVTSADGCVSTDAMRITVKLPKALEIPNAFSPNGDGFNDRWVIKHIDEYPNAVVQIFNRYGKQIYEITGYSNSNAWDGKVSGADLPVGPYYYIIKPNSKLKPISGVISIIR